MEAVKTKNPDYAYYKLGIKYYKNINPNYFYKRNPDTTFDTKTRDELLAVLNKIYGRYGVKTNLIASFNLLF